MSNLFQQVPARYHIYLRGADAFQQKLACVDVAIGIGRDELKLAQVPFEKGRARCLSHLHYFAGRQPDMFDGYLLLGQTRVGKFVPGFTTHFRARFFLLRCRAIPWERGVD
jgi:hypothetical protein